MADVQAGLGRIARELRDMTAWRDRGSGAEDARAELARLWSRIEDIVEHRLEPAMEDARGMAHDARAQLREGRDAALETAERLREATRAHPLLALGIAATAAFAIASLVRARR
jgi:ElaB/YqjD/DUF883 family membrane-anchored ribosome-binding protein